MKKILLILMVTSSINLLSDDGTGRHEMHAFYQFAVTNPPQVVEAMDEFYASDCGKKYPADVVLFDDAFNGSSPSTHFFINSYESMEDYEVGQALVATCPAAAAFFSKILPVATPVSEFVTFQALEVGDWTKDRAFMRFDLKVESGKAGDYLEEFIELANSNENELTSSYGLNSVIYGSTEFTHFIYIGGSDFASLTKNQMAQSQSDAQAKFLKKVKGMREVVNISYGSPIKAWLKR